MQESLTNVLRHAAAATVQLGVTREGETVAVEVLNDGLSRAAGRTADRSGDGGHGIAGMRERIAALGGELQAEAVDGGFRVTARMPAVAGES